MRRRLGIGIGMGMGLDGLFLGLLIDVLLTGSSGGAVVVSADFVMIVFLTYRKRAEGGQVRPRFLRSL